MLSHLIEKKFVKIQETIGTYLYHDKKKDQINHQVINNTVRRAQNIYQIPTNNSQNHNPSNISSTSLNLYKHNQLPLKYIVLQGKHIEKPGIIMKVAKKQKQVNITYSDETKYRLDIKIIDNSFEMKKDVEKGIIQISFKKLVIHKLFKQDNKDVIWMLQRQIKDNKIVLICLNKESVKNIVKGLFQGLISDENMKNVENLNAQLPEDAENIKQEEKQESDMAKFSLPSTQQLVETQKIRKAISKKYNQYLEDIKQEQKLMIMVDIFKIKKQYEENINLQRKKLKCPIHSCQKIYRQVNQLKSHLKKHPELNKHGIQLTQYGTFEYSHKAIDLALYLGKVFPTQMKKIIKKMKTKPISQ